MKALNKLISFLLVLSLSTYGIEVHAQSEIFGDEENEANFTENPPGTAAGITCTQFGKALPENGVCCVGLMNKNNRCVFDEPVDPNLVNCNPGENSCGNGTVCLPQSINHQFSTASPSQANEDDRLELDRNFRRFIETRSIAPKKNGSTCKKDQHCESYFCNIPMGSNEGQCAPKNVCRFGTKEDQPNPNLKCAAGLEKNEFGACVDPDESSSPEYVGLITEPIQVVPGDSCSFELESEVKDRAQIALQSLRAMEFFFANITLPAGQDCSNSVEALKKIGKEFYEKRKPLLAKFTTTLNEIEADYDKMIAASEKYRIAMETKEKPEIIAVKVHGEEISDEDLATRQTSGYDTLKIMERRNNLFMEYEQEMLKIVDETHKKLKDFEEKKLKLSGGKCSPSKYKYKKLFKTMFKWVTEYYSGGDKWAFHYEVRGGGSPIFEDQGEIKSGVTTELAFIKSETPNIEDVKKDFKKTYYLIDPLLYGGMSKMGSKKDMKSSSSFFGLFGFEDLRKANYLTGADLARMLQSLKPKVREFYKNLNPGLPYFIYEPELLTTEAKDCIKSNEADEMNLIQDIPNSTRRSNCTEFKPFLDNVAEGSFAHFLANSYNTSDSYNGMFSNKAYKKKLFSKLVVDTQNLTQYYETLKTLREVQNECILAVIDGLKRNNIHEVDYSGRGVQEGSLAVEAFQSGNVDTAEASKKALKKRDKQVLNPGKLKAKFDTRSLKSLGGNSILDNVNSSADGDRASINDSSSGFALRADAMLKASKKSALASANLNARNKALNELMNSRKRSRLSLASLGPNAKPNGLGSGSNKGASLGNDLNSGEVSGPTGEGIKGDKGNLAINPGANGASGANTAGAYGGYGTGDGSGYGAGQGVNSGSNSGSGSGNDQGVSGTGLTAEQEQKLLDEYNRRKGDFAGDDEDGLFKKVSKAYVRNLEKVLNKKKPALEK